MNIKKIKEKGRGKGCWLVGLLILIILLLGFYCYQNNKEFTLITNSEEYGEFIANGGNESAYLEWVKELEKQDVYGGKTPEETLEMYIKALENRDFELASKYFVLEDQEKEYEELVVLGEDKINSYLNVLNTAKPTSYSKTFNTYELRSFFDREDVLITKFIKNNETNLWKLESL
ncbi:hypothetical protein KJ603_01240 [Patescibacteria group bacterium]|nr:hypothetical protein [Patescibacteria group bacterium]